MERTTKKNTDDNEYGYHKLTSAVTQERPYYLVQLQSTQI